VAATAGVVAPEPVDLGTPEAVLTPEKA